MLVQKKTINMNVLHGIHYINIIQESVTQQNRNSKCHFVTGIIHHSSLLHNEIFQLSLKYNPPSPFTKFLHTNGDSRFGSSDTGRACRWKNGSRGFELSKGFISRIKQSIDLFNDIKRGFPCTYFHLTILTDTFLSFFINF